MNTLSKAFAVILAVLLLFYYPISEAYQRQDDISYVVALRTVTDFVDAVRNKGCITPKMYNDFFANLEATGNTYDIQMEHDHKKYDPVDESSGSGSGTSADYVVDYDDFYNPQIMAVLFPNNSEPLDSPNRIYYLSVGDYFKVTIQNTNRTPATVIRDFLDNGNSDTAKIVIPYGGMVQNEDH